MTSFLYRHRAAGIPWGLWVRVHYRWTPDLEYALVWTSRASEEDRALFEKGLLRAGPLAGRLEITQIDTLGTDFQPEAMFLVGVGVAAQITGDEPDYPEVRFDRAKNVYVVGP